MFVSDEDRELDITNKSKKTKNNVMWLCNPTKVPWQIRYTTLLQRLATVVFMYIFFIFKGNLKFFLKNWGLVTLHGCVSFCYTVK